MCMCATLHYAVNVQLRIALCICKGIHSSRAIEECSGIFLDFKIVVDVKTRLML